MSSRSWVLLLGTWAGLAHAQHPVVPVHAPIVWQAPVQDKNFYLLSMLERTAGVRESVRTDTALVRVRAEKQAALDHAMATCKEDASCFSDSLAWNETDIATVGQALVSLYHQNAAVAGLVDGPLRESGLFVLYQSQPGDSLLAHAWRDAANGMNYIIAVYGQARGARYPLIDSASFNVKSEYYGEIVHTIGELVTEQRADSDRFFTPTLHFALGLLTANDRDEAGRFEPMEAGENAAAYKAIRRTNWSKFSYTMIVVPGEGPDDGMVHIAALSRFRAELAAMRWHAGRAPFILVSGGFVHPHRTPYSEAIEMKRVLMHDYGVPASAIIIDPHARHTTTNLRNAARLAYRYGIPFAKPTLIVTDQYQSAYIENPGFAKRNQNELHYQPYRLLRRVSPVDLEGVPLIESLQADAKDPLDP